MDRRSASSDQISTSFITAVLGPQLHRGQSPNDLHEAIRQLFDLSLEYVLVLDMDCVHRRKGRLTNTSGHLYIFNRCLGFHGKGMPSKVLHFKDITSMKKSTKIADRLKGKIKVYLEDDTSMAFKRIKNRD